MMGPAVSLYLPDPELGTVTRFLRRRVLEDLAALERVEAIDACHGSRTAWPRLGDSGLYCEVLFPWRIGLRMWWRQGFARIQLPNARVRVRPGWRGIRVLVDFYASGRTVLDLLRQDDVRESGLYA